MSRANEGAVPAVGRIVQQIATELRLRVINVVKRSGVATELGDLGTTSILIDDNDLAQRVSSITQGACIRLALDAVGGSATMSGPADPAPPASEPATEVAQPTRHPP